MPCSQKFSQSSSVSSNAVTVTLPAGPNNQNTIVIDDILVCGQSSGAGALTLEYNIAGAGAVIFWRKQLAATAAPESYQLDWGAGWPIWTNSGADDASGGATDIVLRGPATLSNASLLVTWHYAMASEVRS